VTGGKVQVQLRDAVPVTLIDVTTTANIPANAEFHLFVKGSTGASPAVSIYFDGVLQGVTTATAPTAGTDDFNTGSVNGLMATGAGANPFGLLGWGAVFVDYVTAGLTIADFWDATNSVMKTPVGKGSPRMLLTGTAAQITALSTKNEASSGPTMTLVGTLVDA
ncbi:MAG: hypothetical protein ACRCS3_01705, partial [Paracoccaceae bacterium]